MANKNPSVNKLKMFGNWRQIDDYDIYLLLSDIVGPTDADKVKELPTAAVLKVAALGWLNAENALGGWGARHLAVARLTTAFEEFSYAFDATRERGDDKYPVGALAVLDDAYVTVTGPAGASYTQKNLLRVPRDERVERTQYAAVTTVACDLSVLLLQTFARLRSAEANFNTST